MPGAVHRGERRVGGRAVTEKARGEEWAAHFGGQVCSGTAGRLGGEGALGCVLLIGLGVQPRQRELPEPASDAQTGACAIARSRGNEEGGTVRVRAEMGCW